MPCIVAADCPLCRSLGIHDGISAQVSMQYQCDSPSTLCFQGEWRACGLASCVRALYEGSELPTDTILIIRCAYCMAGIQHRPMIGYKDGRFVCCECAHTVRPGVAEYECTCRFCLRMARKAPFNRLSFFRKGGLSTVLVKRHEYLLCIGCGVLLRQKGKFRDKKTANLPVGLHSLLLSRNCSYRSVPNSDRHLLRASEQ
jgi:hypothetical protein